MSMNRSMRRQQARKNASDFYQMTHDKQLQRVMQNGITPQDLKQEFVRGYKAGFDDAGTEVLKTIYAGIVRVLSDKGMDRDQVLQVLQQVDTLTVSSVSGSEDIKQVLDQYGIGINFKQAVGRVESK